MSNNIVLGYINLSFHKVSAGIFQNALEHFGYKVNLVGEPHEKMFALQEKGEVDLLMSAWLPGSHGKYLQSYEHLATKFTPIYTPYCIWAVPSYVSPNVVSDVEHLNRPEALEKFDKDINGIGMGAGISRFSVEMLEAYDLAKNGYRFISNDFHDFCAIVEEKINRKNWFIIPLWHPQYLNHSYRLRALKEPQGLLRSKDEATPILLNASKNKLTPHHIKVLSKITLGNDAIAEMDYTINKKNPDAYEVAKEWINKKFGDIKNFLASFS